MRRNKSHANSVDFHTFSVVDCIGLCSITTSSQGVDKLPHHSPSGLAKISIVTEAERDAIIEGLGKVAEEWVRACMLQCKATRLRDALVFLILNTSTWPQCHMSHDLRMLRCRYFAESQWDVVATCLHLSHNINQCSLDALTLACIVRCYSGLNVKCSGRAHLKSSPEMRIFTRPTNADSLSSSANQRASCILGEAATTRCDAFECTAFFVCGCACVCVCVC